MTNAKNDGPGSRSIVISRGFPAPSALAFSAWSTAEHMKRWFSPADYTTPAAEIDFRVGGVCAICMRSPGGQEFWMRGTFTEFVPPDRLAFTTSVSEGDQPKFTAHTRVTFEGEGAGTRVTVHQAYDFHDEAYIGAVERAYEGWRITLDKLELEVARLEQPDPDRSVAHGMFRLERTYDASPATVFRALSDKGAKARWFHGGPGYREIVREMDVRVGGTEVLNRTWGSGLISTFDATSLDIVANERVVYSSVMHKNERKISVSLATLEPKPASGGTRLAITEQGAFLDGYDDAGAREHGTGLQLNALGASLSA